MDILTKRILSIVIPVGMVFSLGAATVGINNANEAALWQRTCDGTTITEKCHDEDGNKYSKYILHEAEPEVTKTIDHPAEPAKTHVVHHPAVYGTRTVAECIKTNISYKNGTCALSQCRDGSYSGSTGRGTCSYHGGVARSGGPWFVYTEEQYLVSAAWDETVIDVPAKEAWTETIIVTPAKEAWTEKVLAEQTN